MHDEGEGKIQYKIDYRIMYRNIPAKFGSNWPSGFGEA
jgi:hypothetical protein